MFVGWLSAIFKKARLPSRGRAKVAGNWTRPARYHRANCRFERAALSSVATRADWLQQGREKVDLRHWWEHGNVKTKIN